MYGRLYAGVGPVANSNLSECVPALHRAEWLVGEGQWAAFVIASESPVRWDEMKILVARSRPWDSYYREPTRIAVTVAVPDHLSPA
jgi:hypothetical protein